MSDSQAPAPPVLPVPDSSTEEYWAAARDHRLLVRRCTACGAVHFHPRQFCPVCWSDSVEWLEASGRSTLYTFSVVHVNDVPGFRNRTPYVAAVVELEEGPRMMTNVVDCDPADVSIGMALTVTFRDEGDVSLPVFRPARDLA